MELRVVLKLDIGEDKSIENCNKIAQEIYTRFHKENTDLKGIRWNIKLDENKYALGMFFAFSKSPYIKQIIETDFSNVKIYYSLYIKEKDELDDYNKRMNKSNSATAFDQQSLPF